MPAWFCFRSSMLRQFIEAIGEFAVTWVTSVPTMMAMVVRHAKELAAIDTSRVRYVRMGSAPATRQLYAAVHAAFPNASVARRLWHD